MLDGAGGRTCGKLGRCTSGEVGGSLFGKLGRQQALGLLLPTALYTFTLPLLLCHQSTVSLSSYIHTSVEATVRVVGINN